MYLCGKCFSVNHKTNFFENCFILKTLLKKLAVFNMYNIFKNNLNTLF